MWKNGLDYTSAIFTKERLVIGFGLLALTLLAPVGIIRMWGSPAGYRTVPFSELWFSFTWGFQYTSSNSSWIFVMFSWFVPLIDFQLPFRAIFIIEGVRYAEGHSSINRLIISAVLGDLLIMVPFAFIFITTWNIVIAPFPTLLLFGVSLIHSLRGRFSSSSDQISAQPTPEVSDVQEQTVSGSTNNLERAFVLSVVFFLGAFFYPYLLLVGISSFGAIDVVLEAAAYRITVIPVGFIFHFTPLSYMSLIPVYVAHFAPRLFFPIAIYYRLTNRISLKLMIIIGLLLEVVPLIPRVASAIFAPTPNIGIPIPLMTLIATMIAKLWGWAYPPVKSESLN